MNDLRGTNRFLEKWIFLILPFFMLIGLLSGEGIEYLSMLTPYLFMVLTFISSFSADWRRLSDLLAKPWLMLVMTTMLHVLIPFFTLLIAGKIFSTEPDLVVGITLAMMLPIGVTSIFWVGMVQGNVTTALSLVSLNTIVSPLILPFIFSFLLDSVIQVDTASLVLNLLKLVLIPSALGMAAGEWIRKKGPFPVFMDSCSLTSKICLYLVVLFNAASISGNLELVSDKIVQLAVTLFVFMVVGYLLHFGISRCFAKDLETRIAVAYTGGIRNYTVGVVLATTFFTPIVAFPILLAMLLQHPIAMLFNLFFKKVKKSSTMKAAANCQTEMKA